MSRVGQCCFNPKMSKNIFQQGYITLGSDTVQCCFNPKTKKSRNFCLGQGGKMSRKQHWTTLLDLLAIPPTPPPNLFAHFWTEATLANFECWVMPPPHQKKFTHFWIEATLAKSGHLAMYNKYYAMIKTE